MFPYYLVVFILIGNARGRDIFYFTKHPADKTVAEGSAVSLECEVSHTEQIMTYWIFNETRLEDDPRRHQVGRNLVITRTDRLKDPGEYTCIAENITTGYSLTSRAAKLIVAWIGKASIQKVTPEVRDGADLTLRCFTDGTPDIKNEWFRNGQTLHKSEKHQIRPSKNQLIITALSPADNGVYTCAGVNEFGIVHSEDSVVVKLQSSFIPNVVITPQNAMVRRGEMAKFNCSFEAADDIFWSFNKARIQNGNRRTLHKNGTLVISKVRPIDEGIYVCTGVRKKSNSVEYVESYSANLTVPYLDDEFDFEPPLVSNALVIPIQSRLDVSCVAPSGVPQPSVVWVDSSSRTYQNKNLVIENMEESDSGEYTCVVENMAATKKFTVNVVVTVAPKANRDGRTYTLDEGAHLSLSCPYQGSPPPATTFQWHKDGRPVVGGQVNESTGTLVMTSVQPSDRGSYVCDVNTTGFPAATSAPTHVQVKESLKFVPRPVSKNIELTSSPKVHCKAQGFPVPDVHWIKGSIDRAKPLPANIEDVNGTLHFHNASMADRGNYTCIAKNDQGTIDATIAIDVSVAPSFTIYPRNSTEAQAGYPVALHCVAEGDPRPTITWVKDGDMNGLDQTRFNILKNGTLQVSAVYKADSGRYVCIAGSSAGFRRTETELIVRGLDELEGDLEEEESMMTRTVVITLSVVAGYMALVIGLMLWCRYRRRKRKQAYLSDNPEGILLAKAENGDVNREKNDLENGKRLGGIEEKIVERQCDGAEAAHSQSSGHSRRSGRTLNYDKIAFPRHNLRDLKLLGNGVFGQILIGRAEPTKQIVAVKSLQHTREESALAEFKRELDMFYRLSHDHVTRLIGLSRETDPHYLILEYTEWGDLKQFLQSTKKERSKLSTSQLLHLAKQASLGMEHISNNRFVHRDLAARNCVISPDFQLKITMLALSRDVNAADYAQVRNQNIPLRWLPAEVVLDDEYSTKSDVYSFAVLCWELFHQGEKPFANLTDDQVLERLERKDLHIRTSKHAPSSAACLFTACASISPKDRPTFSSIAIKLTEIIADL